MVLATMNVSELMADLNRGFVDCQHLIVQSKIELTNLRLTNNF